MRPKVGLGMPPVAEKPAARSNQAAERSNLPGKCSGFGVGVKLRLEFGAPRLGLVLTVDDVDEHGG